MYFCALRGKKKKRTLGTLVQISRFAVIHQVVSNGPTTLCFPVLCCSFLNKFYLNFKSYYLLQAALFCYIWTVAPPAVHKHDCLVNWCVNSS